jgi:hypothetical protein
MTALARRRAHTPPAPPSKERHLRVVPPPEPPQEDVSRHLRETRWTAALLALATVALIVLWSAALLGAADETWWPPVFAVVFVGVVAFGVLVVRKTR